MLIAKIIQENVTIEIEELMPSFQYSQNLEIQFIRDENYADGILTGWYKKHKEEERLLDIAEDGTFTLPADIFTKAGSVRFSFALNYSDKVIHLGWVELYVKRAFGNTVDILPEEAETWISVVTRVAKNAIIDDVELVKEKAIESSNNAKSALESANLAKTSADNASLSEQKALEYASTAETFKNNASSYADQAGNSAINAAESATNASNSASNALDNANKVKEHLDNINTVISNFNNDYTTKKEAFDTAVNSANTALNATIAEANTSINNKVVEATEQANRAESEADRAQLATDGKLDKNQGAENAGKAMVVDEDGNVVPGDALPKNVYTQEEVNYLLRDKMDKPYTDITISDNTVIDCTMDGNFKINTIAGNTVQETEENIVPTPARPIPIISKKVLASNEYVELRSLKESVNLFDLGLQSQVDLISASGAYRKINVPLQLKSSTAYNFSYSQSDLPKQVWLVLNIIDSSGNTLKTVINNNNRSNEDITLSANTIRFTTTSDGKIFFSCYVGKWSEDLVSVSQGITIFKEYWYTKILKNIMLVEGSTTPTSYVTPTVRDYKIVDHTQQKAWIERNIQEVNLNDLVYSYGGSNGDSEGVRFYAPVNPRLKYVGEMYSNVFQGLSAYDYAKESIYGGNGQGGKTLSIIVKDSNVTAHTQEALLAYINNPNAVAYYALETPIIEEIEYIESDTTEVGSSFQDNSIPSVAIPSEINGVSEINIKTVGKNMLKNDSWVEGYYLSGANGELLRGDKNITSNYIDIMSYTSYTISTNKNLHSMGYGIYDKDKQFLKFLSIGGKNLLVTSNEYEAKYIRVFFNINNTDNATYEMLSSYNPQLELGNTATNYEPYKESAIQYALDVPLYGHENSKDSITAENRINRFNKFVFDGSSDEVWNFDGYTLNSTIRFYMIFANSGNGAGEGVLKVWCDKFKQRNYDIYDTEYVRISTSTTNQNAYVWVYLKKNRLESLNVVGFRKWLQNNPLEVVLETEFPTIEPAPEDLINGLKELRTYSPVTNVFLEGEVNPTINAQYPKDLALAQEKLEATVLNLQEEVVKNV